MGNMVQEDLLLTFNFRWMMLLDNCLGKPSSTKLDVFFTHCVKGGGGVKPICKNLCVILEATF